MGEKPVVRHCFRDIIKKTHFKTLFKYSEVPDSYMLTKGTEVYTSALTEMERRKELTRMDFVQEYSTNFHALLSEFPI